MKKVISILLVCFCVIELMNSSLQAAKIKDYPHQPVPFTKVKFDDSFWLPKIETNRTKTIPFAFKMCEETGRVENFKIAGGLSDAKWSGGLGFNDSDVSKVIEGASYALMVKPDPKLDSYLDEIISYIDAAQEENGYLYTAWTARAIDNGPVNCCYNKKPWDNIANSHELYNSGHMYESAVAHYLATGKKNFLNIATKNADLICDVFGPGKNEGVPGHQEIELGLVKLARATGNDKYLQQAKWFLDQRYVYPGIRSEYSQSHKPVLEQDEAVGHAVRATYMYSSMADVAAMTDNKDYIKAIDAIWQNVVDKKLYVTGGIGARHGGEAYGDNYELPNRTAYCETCANIANVYWNHRMFLFHGESKYIDVMERSLYNGVISGVSLDGMRFFYPNPLESAKGYDRSPWFGCACCPSNICRFMASIPGYAYAVRDNAAYVNLFVNSNATFNIDGTEVSFEQKTQYPWDGRIDLQVTPKKKAKFTVNIRIPDWARGNLDSTALYSFASASKLSPKVKVNGKSAKMNIDKGYLAINRTWKKGDKVQIDLPMEIQRVLCDEKVAENIGKAAIQRGPIVYCIEHPDVEGGKVLNLMLEKDTELTATVNKDLLGGITTISGTAVELRRNENDGFDRTEKKFSMIPYYSWAHRGKGEMAVWIPFNENQANAMPLRTIASESKITASYLTTVGGTGVEFVNDQAMPKSSNDHSKGFLHFWPHKGTSEWVQFDFKKESQIGNVSIYWFDDTGMGECRIPKMWKVLYKADGLWKPVENFTDYKVTINDFDRVSFLPVKTDSIRIEFDLQENFATGIQEIIIE